MLARRQRVNRRHRVLIPHGDDGHRVDIRVGQHVAVVEAGLLHAKFFRLGFQPGGRAGAEGGEFQISDAPDRLAVNLAEPAQPDHANAQSLHAILLKYPGASARES